MHCEFAQSLFLRVRYCIAHKLVLTVLSRLLCVVCYTRPHMGSHITNTHTHLHIHIQTHTHAHTQTQTHTRTYSRTNLNVEGSVLCALMTMFTCARCREYDEPEDYPCCDGTVAEVLEQVCIGQISQIWWKVMLHLFPEPRTKGTP